MNMKGVLGAFGLTMGVSILGGPATAATRLVYSGSLTPDAQGNVFFTAPISFGTRTAFDLSLSREIEGTFIADFGLAYSRVEKIVTYEYDPATGRVTQRITYEYSGNNLADAGYGIYQDFSSDEFRGITGYPHRRYSGNRITTYFPTFERLEFGGRVSGAAPVDYRLSIVSVAGVPEPSTWAVLILGFGAVGASLRRRRNGLRPTALA